MWRHVAITFISGNQRLYLDGVLDGTAVLGGSMNNNPSIPLNIGAWIGGTGYARAMIDEVRIWNIVRTQDEIRQTMSTQLTGLEPGLVSYWRFDDGFGLVATNMVTTNYNGVLKNGPTWILGAGQ